MRNTDFAGQTPRGPELNDVNVLAIFDIHRLAFDPLLDPQRGGGIAEPRGARGQASERGQNSYEQN